MASYPFQKLDLYLTNGISSEHVLIFGKQNTCILDSIIFSNNLDIPILFSFYLLRDEGDPPATKRYAFANNVSLDNKTSLDWLNDKKSIYLRAGDTLWAYSDYYNNIFSVFISYRELTEIVNV